METFRAAFARIVQETERHGIGVILENHPQGLLADALSIQRFLAQEGYSNVPIIYDVSNALAIGEDPVEGMRILGRRLAIVHVSDSRPGQWRHDPIGSGAIDFRTIGACLAEMRFDGSAVLEILSDDPGGDLVDGRNRLRDAGWCFRA
jgi:deoxyribonuclease-4